MKVSTFIKFLAFKILSKDHFCLCFSADDVITSEGYAPFLEDVNSRLSGLSDNDIQG